MKFLELPPRMTEPVCAVMCALRAPDDRLLSEAFKWLITGRIRFYISYDEPGGDMYVVRGDTHSFQGRAYSNMLVRDWDDFCLSYEVATRNRGVAEHIVHRQGLFHWTGHARKAILALGELCLEDGDDLRKREFGVMIDLLDAIERYLLEPCSAKREHVRRYLCEMRKVILEIAEENPR